MMSPYYLLQLRCKLANTYIIRPICNTVNNCNIIYIILGDGRVYNWKMQRDTSWNKVADWYGKIVGETGHYYHEQIILPGVLRLMNLKKDEGVVDLACGQGILGRQITNNKYLGIDLAISLIDEARRFDKNSNHRYVAADVTREIRTKETFDWATIILGLQNIEKPFKVIRNVASLLKNQGKLLMILNHPCFRIPKHSDWQEQYRMMDSYMSPLRVPIESSPFDKKNNQITYSYHYPLSAYSEMLMDNGLVIEKIEEWVSNKTSTGKMAKIENKARHEFPLFMAIVAKKVK